MMKTILALPLIAIAALGLSACTKHSETDNITVNDTSTNLDAPVTDENVASNAADATLDNSANASDALTNG